MAVSYGGTSTTVIPAQNPGSITPTMPASIAAGNALILFVGVRGDTATVATPSGWDVGGNFAGGGGTLGASAGPSRVYAFTRTATATSADTLGAVTLSGANVAFAQVIRLANATGAWSFGVAGGSDSTVGTAWSVACDVNPGLTAGDYAVVATVNGQAASTWSAQAVAATGVSAWGTAVEVNEINSTTGNDINGYISYHPVTTGTATGIPTITATAAGTTTNTRGVSILVRAREAAPPAPTVDAGIDDDHLVNTAFTRTMGVTGSATSYSWTLQSGPGVTPGTSIGTAQALSWTPTTAGTYVIRATATGTGGTSTPDDATIYVEAAAAINDTFTRTSSTTPGTADTGQQWIPRSGTWGTDGSTLDTVSNADGDVATILAGTAAQTVRATVPAPSTFGGASWGLLARYEVGNTFYDAEVTGDGIVTLKRVVSNGFASVTATAAGTVTTSGVIELSVAEEGGSGTRVIVKYGATEVINVLDVNGGTRPLNGIRAGVRKGFSGGTVSWDDFQVNYTASSGTTVTPDLASVSPATYAPTITATATVTPDLASATSGALAPTVSTAVTATPGIATSSPAAYDPTASYTTLVVPGVASSTAAALAPTITPGPASVTPDVAGAAPTVYAPTVGGTVTVNPDAVSTTVGALSPTVTAVVSATPGVAGAAPTVPAPTVSTIVTVTPGVATSTASALAPTVTPGAVTVTPDVAGATTTAYAPVANIQGGPITAIPAVVGTAATASAPTATGAVTVSPGVANSTPSTFAPALAATVTVTADGAGQIATAYGAVLVPTVTLTPGPAVQAPQAWDPSATVLEPPQFADFDITWGTTRTRRLTATTRVDIHGLTGTTRTAGLTATTEVT